MLFIALLILTTFSIAGSAAWFSIYGLANIFSGAFWPVVIMGSSLEAGKLIAASFLYRYYKKISFLMKIYLTLAIFVLMVITSAGIYGFLAAAYQQDVLPLEEMEAKVELLKDEKEELQTRKKAMDDQIAQMPPNYITARIRLQREFAPELEKINKRIPEITSEIQELTNKVINTKVHVGPIIFIAKSLGEEVDDATKYMILLIIFAFDPLAVMLTIGANIAILDRKRIKDEKKEQQRLEEKEEQRHQEELERQHAEIQPDDILSEIRSVIPESQQKDGAETLERLKQILDGLNQKEELTPEEMAKREELQRLLNRDQIIREIRTA